MTSNECWLENDSSRRTHHNDHFLYKYVEQNIINHRVHVIEIFYYQMFRYFVYLKQPKGAKNYYYDD